MPPGKAEVRHHYNHRGTIRQDELCRQRNLSLMSTPFGGKIKTVPLTRSTVLALTPVNGLTRGTLRPTTSTIQRTSRRACRLLFSIVVPDNIPYPPRQHPISLPHCPPTHGETDPLGRFPCLTAAEPSSIHQQSLENNAASGWLGLAAPTPSSRSTLNILIDPWGCEC